MMLSPQEMQLAGEIARAGFEVATRVTTGADGSPRCHLTGRGPYGAFVVSAPTVAGAYRSAVDHVLGSMVPVRLARRGGY